MGWKVETTNQVVLLLNPQKTKVTSPISQPFLRWRFDRPQRMVQMMLQLICGPRRPKWLSIESALTTRSANLKEMDGSWYILMHILIADMRPLDGGPFFLEPGIGIQDSLEWKEGTYDHIVFFPWRQTVRFGCLFFHAYINRLHTHHMTMLGWLTGPSVFHCLCEG